MWGCGSGGSGVGLGWEWGWEWWGSVGGAGARGMWPRHLMPRLRRTSANRCRPQGTSSAGPRAQNVLAPPFGPLPTGCEAAQPHQGVPPLHARVTRRPPAGVAPPARLPAELPAQLPTQLPACGPRASSRAAAAGPGRGAGQGCTGRHSVNDPSSAPRRRAAFAISLKPGTDGRLRRQRTPPPQPQPTPTLPPPLMRPPPALNPSGHVQPGDDAPQGRAGAQGLLPGGVPAQGPG